MAATNVVVSMTVGTVRISLTGDAWLTVAARRHLLRCVLCGAVLLVVVVVLLALVLVLATAIVPWWVDLLLLVVVVGVSRP